MTDLEKAIIERIKAQMKMKDINQIKLGKALNIKQYQVSRLLNGKPFPSIDQLFLIADTLDCSINYLLGLRDETYQELSKETSKVAHGYLISNDSIKLIIKRILDID